MTQALPHPANKRLNTLRFFFSSRRRHTRLTCDWSSDVCSSDLLRSTGSRRTCWARRRCCWPCRMCWTTRRRTEERRVGKECRWRWSRYYEKKKRDKLSWGARGAWLLIYALCGGCDSLSLSGELE